ncbi:hypothetical protein [Emticicia sp. BO119]|uniref:hypothetical protein n=1 Tax=Emticicia sp. BO119 TaxID=2757768 RepID=UPI0015F098DC|nr:hypothetical protein [Emticicia sp. BO119]MBA4853910.1 hypothetical protein [Emticicia sp. BO119]
MKTKIVILLLSLLLKACIKNEKPVAEAAKHNELSSESIKPLIKITYPEDELSQKSFVYDASGNLIKFNSISDTAYYTYTKDHIHRKWVDTKGAPISEQEFSLDKDGRIIASTFTETAIGKIYETAYAYNAEGFLIKAITKNFTTNKDNIIVHSYKAGNLISTRYLTDDKLDMELWYEYDSNHENKIALNVSSVDEYFTGYRMGKLSKNVIIQSLCKSAEGDTLSHLKYKNEFDKGGYLVKTTEQDIINEISVEKLYHYKN